MCSKNGSLPSMDPNAYCRLCFSDRNLTQLFNINDTSHELLQGWILSYIGIEISPTESVPSSICWRCAITLEDFQILKERSLKNEVIIRDIFTGDSNGQIELKYFKTEPSDGNSENEIQDETNQLEYIDVDEENVSNKTVAEISSDQQSLFDLMWKCSICNINNSSKQSFEDHVKEKHSSDDNPYTCSLCPAVFNRSEILENHTASHFADSNFKCKECLEDFSSFGTLQQHRLTYHDVKKRCYPCKYCDQIFKFESGLYAHIQKHTDKLVVACEFCSARFANKKGLVIHHGIHHSKEPSKRTSLKCTKCSRYFRQARLLAKHMTLKHSQSNGHADNQHVADDAAGGQMGTELSEDSTESEIVPLDSKYSSQASSSKWTSFSKADHQSSKSFSKPVIKCDLCELSFECEQSFDDHVKEKHSYNDRPYKCLQCPRVFKKRGHLNDHSLSHSDETDFKCQYCSARFNKPRTLHQHQMKFHHPEFKSKTPKKISIPKDQQSKKKIYQCKYCNRTFQSKSTLHHHVNSHTDMLCFACEICGKRFANKNGLLIHHGIHHSKQPSGRSLKKCPECSKYFQYMRDLDEHMISEHSKSDDLTGTHGNNSGDKQNSDTSLLVLKIEMEDIVVQSDPDFSSFV